MRKRYKISLLVIAIMLAFCMTIATSYAFWTFTVPQTGVNKVTTGCLKIQINDLDVDGNSTSINLTNAYPMSDAKGILLEPYTLTITNVCSLDAEYTILLNTLSVSELTENEMKYQLIKTSPTEVQMTPTIISSKEKVALDSSVKNNIETDIDESIQGTYRLESGVLKGQDENVTDSVTYELRLWIDETTGNEIMGDTFKTAVAVYAQAAKIN